MSRPILTTLKEAGGDAAKATPDQAAVDAVLLDYFKAVMPFEEAQGGGREAGRRQRSSSSSGSASSPATAASAATRSRASRTTQPIGTELSEEGSKLVSRLDFAFVHDIPHTSKIAWFRTKLHDPRIFDEGRVLQPLDKLRMPNFDFTDEEVERLLTAIMSFQREIQPARRCRRGPRARDFLVQGRTLVHRRNCVGCHIIEGDGGDFLKLVAEPSLGPPLLTPEGARVQPDWLYAFLRGPITIRPWLNVRMPTFGLDDQNLNGVIQLLRGGLEQLGPFQTHRGRDAGERRTPGRQAAVRAAEVPAVPRARGDSEGSADVEPRARICGWRPTGCSRTGSRTGCKNPAAILPGTRMPAFWPDYPKSPYPQLGGDAEAQIRAIRDHLLTLRGGPSPRQPAQSEGSQLRAGRAGGTGRAGRETPRLRDLHLPALPAQPA